MRTLSVRESFSDDFSAFVTAEVVAAVTIETEVGSTASAPFSGDVDDLNGKLCKYT